MYLGYTFDFIMDIHLCRRVVIYEEYLKFSSSKWVEKEQADILEIKSFFLDTIRQYGYSILKNNFVFKAFLVYF